MLLGLTITAFAAGPELMYDSSYDGDTGLVTVSIYIKNAVGAEAIDLNLGYNPEMFEYKDCTSSDAGNNTMIVAGKSSIENGLCTCSVIFAESCAKGDLDENGNLQLATYTFAPLGENFDINDFGFWATSFDMAGGVNIIGRVEPYGDVNKKTEHTFVVTAPSTSSGNTSAAGNANEAANDNKADGASAGTPAKSGSSKWYIYVIAGVLAIGAVVGIALIAVRNGKNEEQENGAEDGSAKTDSPNEETDKNVIADSPDSDENAGTDGDKGEN